MDQRPQPVRAIRHGDVRWMPSAVSFLVCQRIFFGDEIGHGNWEAVCSRRGEPLADGILLTGNLIRDTDYPFLQKATIAFELLLLRRAEEVELHHLRQVKFI